MAAPLDLTLAQVRRLAVVAQGMTGRRSADPRAALAAVGAIQLDTISVVARSHELVCAARLTAAARPHVDDAFFGGGGAVFEYWAHAAAIVPMDIWPYMAWRRRKFAARNAQRASPSETAAVLARLAESPITTADIGGARSSPGWWEWSPSKRAIERLLASGTVVCAERRGWRRVYDLTERVVPRHLLAEDLDDAACFRHLAADALLRLGVGTVDDIADYYRQPVAATRIALEEVGAAHVRVDGWDRPAYASAAALADPGRRVRHDPVLLSPFDSLVWYRPRTQRLFDFHQRLEAYTPPAARVHGYYAMPLLDGCSLVGRIDMKRHATFLEVRRATLTATALDAAASALWRLAAWLGLPEIRCAEMVGDGLGRDLARAVAAAAP